MEQAKEIVDEAMHDGAVGMSTGLIYTPGTWSKTEEIVELQKVAAEYGGIYAIAHAREATEILDAIDEALRVGREADCRVQISHFKLPRDVAATIGGRRDAQAGDRRARGGAGGVARPVPLHRVEHGHHTLLPDWVLEKGADEAKKKLAGPRAGRRRCSPT